MSGNQLGLLSLIISACVALYSAGWIPGIAKQTDVSTLSAQIVDIKNSIDRVGREFAETRIELVKTATTIARIEGKLEAAAPLPRPAAVKVRVKPVPPKPKGLFE